MRVRQRCGVSASVSFSPVRMVFVTSATTLSAAPTANRPVLRTFVSVGKRSAGFSKVHFDGRHCRGIRT